MLIRYILYLMKLSNSINFAKIYTSLEFVTN